MGNVQRRVDERVARLSLDSSPSDHTWSLHHHNDFPMLLIMRTERSLPQSIVRHRQTRSSIERKHRPTTLHRLQHGSGEPYFWDMDAALFRATVAKA